LKETFQFHGFFFNYFAPEDGIESLREVEFYQLRNSMFDHQPIIEKLDGNLADDLEKLKKIVGKIQTKRDKAEKISEQISLSPSNIKKVDYTKWLYSKFSDPAALRETDTPIYATCIQRRDINLQFEYVDLALDQIYYRTTRVVGYKVFQAVELFRTSNIFCRQEDDLAVFEPISLFDNSSYRYYPVNMPVVEYNGAKKRYEVAEGHSRLYALTKFPNIKRTRVILVKNLPPFAFEIDSDFSHGEPIIKNSWNTLFVTREYFSEPKICRYIRNIESVTHYLPKDSYQEFGELLVKKNLLLPSEAVEFSLKKYKNPNTE
jgi:hypothetical protein